MGYLVRKELFGAYGMLQPYASLQWTRYEHLADPMALASVGINWLISGQNSKFMLNNKNGPSLQCIPAATSRAPVAGARQLFNTRWPSKTGAVAVSHSISYGSCCG